MLRNYFTIAIRNLMRQKMYSLINILGLTTGLACCMLILCYVNYEHQYDQHHPNVDRIYKVLLKKRSLAGEYIVDPTTAGKLAPTLQEEYPEVELGLRTFVRPVWLSNEQIAFRQSVCFADPHIMDLFSYPLVSGDPKGLHTSYGAFITESIARKFFGDENPLGKRIKTDYKWDLQGEYTVVGILEDMPKTSTYDLRFDMVTSTIPPGSYFERMKWTAWTSFIKSYVLLKRGADPKALEAKLPAILEKYWPEEMARSRTYYLQPISRMHLYSRSDYGLTHASYGDGVRVNTFLLIACFILLIACINFMNLTTAQSMRRAQEVGLRKVGGAVRHQLIGQFLTESILLTCIALILALATVALVLPYISTILNRDLMMIKMTHLIPIVLIITVLTGFISGSYPAFFLSKFQPIDVLKGSSVSTGKKQLRQFLVILQFAIAIALLIGTTVAYQQTVYLLNKHLGFESEQIVSVPIFFADRNLNARYETVKQAFLQHPNIQKASATTPKSIACANSSRPFSTCSKRRNSNFTTLKMDGLYVRRENQTLFDHSCNAALTSRTRDILNQAWDKVNDAYKNRYAEPKGLRVIHNDLHQENINVYHGKLYPYDFEDTVWGYPVQDIATAMFDLILDAPEKYSHLRTAFRHGYESHSPWPETYPEEIDTFQTGFILWRINFIARGERKGDLNGWIQLLEKFLRTGIVNNS